MYFKCCKSCATQVNFFICMVFCLLTLRIDLFTVGQLCLYITVVTILVVCPVILVDNIYTKKYRSSYINFFYSYSSFFHLLYYFYWFTLKISSFYFIILIYNLIYFDYRIIYDLFFSSYLNFYILT